MAADLGAVDFRTSLRSEPRKRRGSDSPRPRARGGALAALPRVHGGAYKSRWGLHFGAWTLKLDNRRHLPLSEELLVFLIELFDGGFGEWTAQDDRDELSMEGEVHGPDVHLRFGNPDRKSPRFGGRAAPRKAAVRLRALVEEGAQLIEGVLDEAASVDEDFAARDELADLRADLRALREAVAELPRAFRTRGNGG